jgi:hypothetical protein
MIWKMLFCELVLKIVDIVLVVGPVKMLLGLDQPALLGGKLLIFHH